MTLLHSKTFITIGMVIAGLVIISTIILMIFFITSLHLITIAKDPNKWKKNTNTLTLIAIGAYVFAAMCSSIQFPLAYHTIDLFGIISVIISVSWLIAQITVDLLLIIRLKYAFIGTKYETKKITITLLKIILFLFAVVTFSKEMIVLYETVFIPQSWYSPVSTFPVVLASFNLIMIIIDLILSISLIYLFVSKLILIAVQSVKNNVDSLTNYYNEQNKQILSQLLNVAVKYMILTSISVIATQILLLYFAVKDYISSYTQDTEFYLYGIMCEYIGWPIEMIINSICIILYLPKTDKIYDK